jgi:hypothetical protein
MKVDIVEATVEHISYILSDLRAREQSIFSACSNPEKVILDEMRRSTRSFAGLIDDRMACLWGIKAGTLLGDSAELWLLTTKLVEDCPFIFVRHSQMVLQIILGEYSRVYGYVLEENEQSIRWLQWLGCKLTKTVEPGVFEFNIRRRA